MMSRPRQLLEGSAMKIICAWCGRTLKEGDQDQLKDQSEVLVSHGICIFCAAKIEIEGPPHGLEEALEDGQIEEILTSLSY
jgi:hypothetical protein